MNVTPRHLSTIAGQLAMQPQSVHPKLQQYSGQPLVNSPRNPSELRNVFGQNLRRLSKSHNSISDLSRKLGINRTQFNRYLSGESFPRPDVLDRICRYFGVDARILLEPVDQIVTGGQILTGPILADFLGSSHKNLRESDFPSGFYRFARRSFVDTTRFVVGLVYVFRKNGFAYVRGYEAKEALRQQHLPCDPRAREFRGSISRQGEGIALLISGRNGATGSYNFLSRSAAMQDRFWTGYVTRSVRESVTETRITRMVYEHLGTETAEILHTARTAGLLPEDRLMPFHRRLLRPDLPFQ